MNLPANSNANRGTTRSGGIASLAIAATSLLRGLPLFFAARPSTPLRVLCIMVFDTLHRLRSSRKLPSHRIRLLTALLDFGACANAAFDGKKFCPQEFHRTWQLLEDAGFGLTAQEYWRRIQELERRRPCPGGDRVQFQRVKTYREDVVQLSLGALTTMVFELKCLDDGIQAVRAEGDLAIVFQVVMQCQIIDDVVDYSKDAAGRLPSFLTVPESIGQAIELTGQAACTYANDEGLPRSADLLPLRLALVAVSAVTKLLITLGRWRQRVPLVESQPVGTFEP